MMRAVPGFRMLGLQDKRRQPLKSPMVRTPGPTCFKIINEIRYSRNRRTPKLPVYGRLPLYSAWESAHGLSRRPLDHR
jgi:hypothetical protein